MSELKTQIINWLYEIEEKEAADFLEKCEIDNTYIDTAFPLYDNQVIDVYDVSVYTPPKIYKEITQKNKQYSIYINKLEEAIRDNADADNISVRNVVWKPLINYDTKSPNEPNITEILIEFSSQEIHKIWSNALSRQDNDPEGAITLSRSMVESVCKHILDDRNISYNSKNIELSELYKLTATELNLAPEQHDEKIFKQILGGCSAIVNGLGLLRNNLGDAHGPGRNKIKPKARHASLAVNLSGSMCLFLIETHKENKKT